MGEKKKMHLIRPTEGRSNFAGTGLRTFGAPKKRA